MQKVEVQTAHYIRENEMHVKDGHLLSPPPLNVVYEEDYVEDEAEEGGDNVRCVKSCVDLGHGLVGGAGKRTSGVVAQTHSRHL